MSRIENLTPAQRELMFQRHAEWLQIAFETRSADRVTSENAISAMYGLIKKPKPIFIWTDSPATAILAIHVLKKFKVASLGDSLRASLWASLRASLGDSLRASLRDCYWGQHDSYWIAFYLFAKEIGVTYAPGSEIYLKLWEDLSRSMGWWFPYDHLVICCERQREIHMESTKRLIGNTPTYRLHSNNTPALRFADGWSMYVLHGIRVPAKYILLSADMIDPVDVIKEPNAQVRMAVINKVGFTRMLSKLPHRVIGTSPNQRGIARRDELIEFDLGQNNLVRGLHIWWKEKSGEEKENVIPVWRTKEQFGIDCPDNINDCEQVRRWVMRLPENAEIVEEV